MELQQFFCAVLQKINAPCSDTNQAVLGGLAYSEYGGQNPLGYWNPLNTTVGQGRSLNSVGVKMFDSADAGIAATAQTLQQANFSALRQGLQQQLGPAWFTTGEGASEISLWQGGGGTRPTSGVSVLKSMSLARLVAWVKQQTMPGSSADLAGSPSSLTANDPKTPWDAIAQGIQSGFGALGTTVTQDLARAGFLLAGLLLFVLGLALVVVPEFLKKAPLPVKAPLKVLTGGQETAA